MANPNPLPYISNQVQVYIPHSAITADVAAADAALVQIAGAKKIMIELTEGGTVLNRQCDLTVQVSLDGINFFAYNMLISNATNTNSQQFVRVATQNIAAAGTTLLFMTPETLGAFTHLRIPMDVTDGATPTGNFTVKVSVQT